MFNEDTFVTREYIRQFIPYFSRNFMSIISEERRFEKHDEKEILHLFKSVLYIYKHVTLKVRST
jgi:hypothetical protein